MSEVVDGQSKASNVQIEILRDGARYDINNGNALGSQLVSAWLLNAICNELLERRAAKPLHEREPPHCATCACHLPTDEAKLLKLVREVAKRKERCPHGINPLNVCMVCD